MFAISFICSALTVLMTVLVPSPLKSNEAMTSVISSYPAQSRSDRLPRLAWVGTAARRRCRLDRLAVLAVGRDLRRDLIRGRGVREAAVAVSAVGLWCRRRRSLRDGTPHAPPSAGCTLLLIVGLHASSDVPGPRHVRARWRRAWPRRCRPSAPASGRCRRRRSRSSSRAASDSYVVETSIRVGVDRVVRAHRRDVDGGRDVLFWSAISAEHQLAGRRAAVTVVEKFTGT